MARRRKAGSAGQTPILEIVGIVLNAVMIAVWLVASPVPRGLRDASALYAKSERALRDSAYVEALNNYAVIAEKYPSFPVAEDALYKAGWLSLWRVGDVDRAREYFGNYAAAYPEGRFHDQVTSGLDFIDRIPAGRESLGRLAITAVIFDERGEFETAIRLADYLLERSRGTTIAPKLYEIKKRAEEKKYERESMRRW